jgi:hypothetical protein
MPILGVSQDNKANNESSHTNEPNNEDMDLILQTQFIATTIQIPSPLPPEGLLSAALEPHTAHFPSIGT